MIENIKSLLGLGTSTDYKELIRDGAIVLDVRSPMEFKGGHIKGSKNIPLDALATKISSLKDKKQIIITCCASGMRSASAKNILKSNGFQNVYNGGGWMGLNSKI